MPPFGEPNGGSRRVRFAAEPDDQSEGAVQLAFSAISRPWIKQLEIMDTSS